jgi:hypothetical protein
MPVNHAADDDDDDDDDDDARHQTKPTTNKGKCPPVKRHPLKKESGMHNVT